MTAPEVALSAERLFHDAFLPLYPVDAASDLSRARTEDANPSGNPSLFAHLAEAASVFAHLAPRILDADLGLDFTDASVHRLSAALTRETRDRLLRDSNLGSSDSTLFNLVVHGSAYLGECIVRTRSAAGSSSLRAGIRTREDVDARWLVRRPLWESLVSLRSPAGEAELAVFHWWLKALSDDGVDGKVATLADRFRAHVEEPTRDVDAMPAFLLAERRMPRLAKVSYHAFYKYLRAHLPEIREVGADFPSAERFDELELKWLEAHIVGAGRMALLAGASKHGVHLFWLDQNGFNKGAFVPADSFPEPVVRVENDRVRVLVQQDGTSTMREMLWWGL